MLGPLRARPAFRRLFTAHVISRGGDTFNTVALVVLVYELTGSGLGVAATVGFEILPVLLLAPVAGLIADRFPRRSVMIAADLARATLAAFLALRHDRVVFAYAVAFGLSVGTVAFGPAASSLVPETVDSDEIIDANSSLWTAAVTAQVILAPTAGAIIGFLGVGWAFAVNAISYVVSASVLAGMGAGRTPAVMVVQGWRGVAAGVSAIRTHPLLVRLAAVQALASLSAGATGGLLVVLAAEWLRVGPSGFGILLGAIGVGAVAGPVLFRRRVKPADRRWLFGPFALRGGVDLALASVPNPVVATGALALYGVGTSTGTIAYQSTLQTVVAPEVRGRVFAAYDVVWNGVRLVSLGLGGVLADAIGIRAVYYLGGALMMAAVAVGMSGTGGSPSAGSGVGPRPQPGEPAA